MGQSIFSRKIYEKLGKYIVVLATLSLVITAIKQMKSGDPFYKNYWGGLVYAPLAIFIVILGIIAVIKRYLTNRLGSKKISGKEKEIEFPHEQIKF